MSIRLTYTLGFLAIVALLLMSAYLQFFDDFIPCPLCTLQRIAFAALGILFFFGILLARKGWARLVINLFSGLFALLGILLAARQIWLQHSPNTQSLECGVSLEYMLHALPLQQVINKILTQGSNECTKRGWEFLHLNMAEWSLLWFCLFLLLILYLFCKEFKWNDQ